MFYNKKIDKSELKRILRWFIFEYGPTKAIDLLDGLKFVGFHSATLSGLSLGFEDLKTPPTKSNFLRTAANATKKDGLEFAWGSITPIERFRRIIDIWTTTSENLKLDVIQFFEQTDPFNPLYIMAFSGARGNISQVRQLVGMRGLMSDPQGQIIETPIQTNFREGLRVTEYMISCYGARKGLVDTALGTAHAGYLTRRLVDVTQHVIIAETDCHSSEGILIHRPEPDQLVGRVFSETIIQFEKISHQEHRQNIHPPSSLPSKKTHFFGPRLSNFTDEDLNLHSPVSIISLRNQDISPQLAHVVTSILQRAQSKQSLFTTDQTGNAVAPPFSISSAQFVKHGIWIRSPFTCDSFQNQTICQLCYGWHLAYHEYVSLGDAVGVLAAQSIGEPGTQLTMRTFHTGGVFYGSVQKNVQAPHNGTIVYENKPIGEIVRVMNGNPGFLNLTPLSLLLYNDSCYNPQQIEIPYLSRITLPPQSLIYVSPGQVVSQKDILAEFIFVSTDHVVDESRVIPTGLPAPTPPPPPHFEAVESTEDGELYFGDIKYHHLDKRLITPKTMLRASFLYVIPGLFVFSPLAFFLQKGDLVGKSLTQDADLLLTDLNYSSLQSKDDTCAKQNLRSQSSFSHRFYSKLGRNGLRSEIQFNFKKQTTFSRDVIPYTLQSDASSLSIAQLTRATSPYLTPGIFFQSGQQTFDIHSPHTHYQKQFFLQKYTNVDATDVSLQGVNSQRELKYPIVRLTPKYIRPWVRRFQMDTRTHAFKHGQSGQNEFGQDQNNGDVSALTLSSSTIRSEGFNHISSAFYTNYFCYHGDFIRKKQQIDSFSDQFNLQELPFFYDADVLASSLIPSWVNNLIHKLLNQVKTSDVVPVSNGIFFGSRTQWFGIQTLHLGIHSNQRQDVHSLKQDQNHIQSIWHRGETSLLKSISQGAALTHMSHLKYIRRMSRSCCPHLWLLAQRVYNQKETCQLQWDGTNQCFSKIELEKHIPFVQLDYIIQPEILNLKDDLYSILPSFCPRFQTWQFIPIRMIFGTSLFETMFPFSKEVKKGNMRDLVFSNRFMNVQPGAHSGFHSHSPWKRCTFQFYASVSKVQKYICQNAQIRHRDLQRLSKLRKRERCLMKSSAQMNRNCGLCYFVQSSLSLHHNQLNLLAPSRVVETIVNKKKNFSPYERKWRKTPSSQEFGWSFISREYGISKITAQHSSSSNSIHDWKIRRFLSTNSLSKFTQVNGMMHNSVPFQDVVLRKKSFRTSLGFIPCSGHANGKLHSSLHSRFSFALPLKGKLVSFSKREESHQKQVFYKIHHIGNISSLNSLHSAYPYTDQSNKNVLQSRLNRCTRAFQPQNRIGCFDTRWLLHPYLPPDYSLWKQECHPAFTLAIPTSKRSNRTQWNEEIGLCSLPARNKTMASFPSTSTAWKMRSGIQQLNWQIVQQEVQTQGWEFQASTSFKKNILAIPFEKKGFLSLPKVTLSFSSVLNTGVIEQSPIDVTRPLQLARYYKNYYMDMHQSYNLDALEKVHCSQDVSPSWERFSTLSLYLPKAVSRPVCGEIHLPYFYPRYCYKPVYAAIEKLRRLLFSIDYYTLFLTATPDHLTFSKRNEYSNQDRWNANLGSPFFSTQAPSPLLEGIQFLTETHFETFRIPVYSLVSALPNTFYFGISIPPKVGRSLVYTKENYFCLPLIHDGSFDKKNESFLSKGPYANIQIGLEKQVLRVSGSSLQSYRLINFRNQYLAFMRDSKPKRKEFLTPSSAGRELMIFIKQYRPFSLRSMGLTTRFDSKGSLQRDRIVQVLVPKTNQHTKSAELSAFQFHFQAKKLKLTEHFRALRFIQQFHTIRQSRGKGESSEATVLHRTSNLRYKKQYSLAVLVRFRSQFDEERNKATAMHLEKKSLISTHQAQLQESFDTNETQPRHLGRLVKKTKTELIFRVVKPCLIPTEGSSATEHGEQIFKHDLLFWFSQQKSKTGDIVQGLPKINRLFEARQIIRTFQRLASPGPEDPKDSLPDSIVKLVYPSLIENMEQKGLSIQNRKWDYEVLFQTKGSQIDLLNQIQGVFESQGVSIHDKHIEVIVRQMTSKVLLLTMNDLGFLPGDTMSFRLFRRLVPFCSDSLLFTPLVIGITKLSLRHPSILAPASFQETKRVLVRSALTLRPDFLGGLKEHVMFGQLIPAGTGFQAPHSFQSPLTGYEPEFCPPNASISLEENPIIRSIKDDLPLRIRLFPSYKF